MMTLPFTPREDSQAVSGSGQRCIEKEAAALTHTFTERSRAALPGPDDYLERARVGIADTAGHS